MIQNASSNVETVDLDANPVKDNLNMMAGSIFPDSL